MMDRYRLEDPFVPIDFKTRVSEKKFLIAGLHSGGKSFFLENIVLASILGQAGLMLPADSIKLPKYDHIYYYRNVDNCEGGKLETELRAVDRIINKAGSGDLIVIDEFLDSTSAEIANSLGSSILDRLVKSKSTVFVTSHRNTNYDQLSKAGWTLLSPDYDIEGEKVKPTLSLTRGPPDAKVNERYILEKYDGIFGAKKRR